VPSKVRHIRSLERTLATRFERVTFPEADVGHTFVLNCTLRYVEATFACHIQSHEGRLPTTTSDPIEELVKQELEQQGPGTTYAAAVESAAPGEVVEGLHARLIFDEKAQLEHTQVVRALVKRADGTRTSAVP